MAFIGNDDSIEITLEGNESPFALSLDRSKSFLHNFTEYAQNEAASLAASERASAIRSAQLFQQRMNERASMLSAMHRDEIKRESDSANQRAKIYGDFTKAASSVIKQQADAEIKSKTSVTNTTNALLANSFNTFKNFANQEKTITQSTASSVLKSRKEIADKTKDLLESVNKKNKELAAEELKLNNQVAASRRAVLSTVAHSLPFGLGRTLAWAEMNAPAMATQAGAGGVNGAVASFSSTLASIPIPIILAVAAAFKIVEAAAHATERAVKDLLIPAIEKGLMYNDLIANSRLGMAGVISQLTEIYRGDNLITDAQGRWTGALIIGVEITEQLKDVALKTKAVYQDLARGMQEGMAPFLQMGGRQDQLTPFVTNFIHLMTTLRIPLREIGQEIRAFSNLETNPRTARASFQMIGMYAKELGISISDAKEKLKGFKDDNTLVDWFIKNSQEFKRSGEAAMGTLSGQLSNVKELVDRILGEGTQDLYNQLTGNLNNLINQFVTFDEKGKAAFSPQLVEFIRNISSAIGSLIEIVAKVLPLVNSLAESINNLARIKQITVDILFTIPPYLKEVIQFLKEHSPNAPESNLSNTIVGQGGIPLVYSGMNYLRKSLGMTPEQEASFKNWNVPLNSGLNKYTFQAEKNKQDRAITLGSLGETDADIVKKNQEDLTKADIKYWNDKAAREKKNLEEWRREHEKAVKAVEDLYSNMQTTIQSDEIKASTLPQGLKDFYDKILEINKTYENYQENLQDQRKTLAPGSETLAQWEELVDLSKRHKDNLIAAEYIRLATHKVEDLPFAPSGAENKPIPFLLSNFKTEGDLEREAAQVEKLLEQTMRRGAEAFNKAVQTYWTGPMSSVFADLGKTGGKNFLSVMRSGFDNLIGESASTITNKLADLLGFGGKLAMNPAVTKDGVTTPAYFTRTDLSGNVTNISNSEFDASKRRQEQLQAAMAAAQIGFGSYQQGKTAPKGSITAGIIGGGLTGAGIGLEVGAVGGLTGVAVGIIGAIAGAIIGGIAAAMGKADARAQYKFATPIITTSGDVGFTGVNKNIQKPELDEMIARTQETFDKFWSGYTDLAIRIAGKFLPKLSDMAGIYSIQPEASANFLKHFEELLAGVLPDKVMDKFKPVLQARAVELGMSFEKFNQVFAKLNKLEPGKTLELLNTLFDTLQNFAEISKRAPSNFGWEYGGMASPWSTLKMHAMSEDVSPMAAFKDIDKQIRDAAALSAAFGSMTSEQQLNAAKNLSDLTLQRIKLEEQAAKELVDFLENSGRTFDDFRRQMQLDIIGSIGVDESGKSVFKPDLQGQANFLDKYLNTNVMGGIQGAKNTEQLNFWQGEFFKTIQQMGDIYKQMGPEAYQAYQQWLLGGSGQKGVLDLVQNSITSQADKWGTAIADSTAKLFNDIQPAIDLFKTALTDAATIIGDNPIVIPDIPDAGIAINKLIGNLDNLGASVIRLQDVINGISGGSAGINSAPSDYNDVSAFNNRVVNRRLASTGR